MKNFKDVFAEATMNKNEEKFVIKMKVPNEKEWKSKVYSDFMDAYDDFPKIVEKMVKKYKLDSPADFEYRYIDTV
jgi:hypothetical protein